MEEETELFLSYFKPGVFYMPGGVESGFKHVEPTVYETRLLLVKGNRNPRVFNMPVSADSLNEGDCFVLDCGLTLYYWAGADSNNREQVKALEIAAAIKNHDRKAKASLHYPRDVGGDVEKEFWEILGGKPDKIAPAKPDDPPPGTEEEMAKYALYHISDASGSVVTTEITERPLRRDHLSTNDSYILELFDQVYVWIGKRASQREK
jgi:gelsolin